MRSTRRAVMLMNHWRIKPRHTHGERGEAHDDTAVHTPVAGGRGRGSRSLRQIPTTARSPLYESGEVRGEMHLRVVDASELQQSACGVDRVL